MGSVSVTTLDLSDVAAGFPRGFIGNGSRVQHGKTVPAKGFPGESGFGGGHTFFDYGEHFSVNP